MNKSVRSWAKIGIGAGIAILVPTAIALWHFWTTTQSCELTNSVQECAAIFDTAFAWLSWPLSLVVAITLPSILILLSKVEFELEAADRT